MWQQPLQPSQYPSYAYGTTEAPIPQEASIGNNIDRKREPIKKSFKNKIK